MPLLNDRDIASILNGCLRNDRKSQKELYCQLYEVAIKICYRFTNDREECIELVNESFLRLLKSLSLFDKARNTDILLSLKEWFKRILINTCCIDHYHKINSDINSYGGNSIGELSGAEPIEAIRSLLPTYRMVFNLFVIDGFSHEEISQMLGISVDASQSRLSKARGHLKTLLLNNNML